nr:hypothetical protein [Tanacetum cinerariifolium]
MTRSTSNKLFTPYKEPQREFRSSRKHFKTLSLDKLRSPDFNILSDKEYSEEEVTETMAETIEQYISKTRADYGSGVSRPNIKNKDNFEMKGQFLKELRTNTSAKWQNRTSKLRSTETSDGLASIQAQLNNLGREIKKVNEKVYAAQVRCEHCKRPYYTKDCPLKEGGKTLEEVYYTEPERSSQVDFTTIEADSRPIRRIGSAQYVVSTRQNHTLMYETRQTVILFPNCLNGYYCKENKGSYGPQFSKAYSEASQSIPQKEKDPGSFTLPCFINNVCFGNALVDLGASVSVMPLLTYLNLGLGELAHSKLTVELADRTVKYPKGIAENVLVRIGKFVLPVDFIILDMPVDIKVPLILEISFLSTARAKIDVYKRKITLRVGEEKVIFISVKPASSLIKRVYMLSLRE